MESVYFIEQNYQDPFWEDVQATPCNLLENKQDGVKQKIVQTQCDIVEVVQEKKGKIFESRNLFDKVRGNIFLSN